jgi:F-type H+-transporting ATPase subunit epsilon
MSVFQLEILTPERQFYSGEVQSLTVPLEDGSMGVLANHMPMVAPIIIGSLKITTPDEVLIAFNSEGFIDVKQNNTVYVFCQVCEWPQEIDENRAKLAVERAERALKVQRGIGEHQLSQLALARAMERLKVKSLHM